MVHSTRVALVLFVALVASACSKESSPVQPTPPAATRIIRLGGNLDFGLVPIRTVREDGVLTVSNDGNADLHVSGMTGPCASLGIGPMSTPTFGVAPGETVSVGFRFAPTVPINCSGTITVNGDQTSGTNTIAITAMAR